MTEMFNSVGLLNNGMLKNRNLLIMSITFLVLLISSSYKAQIFIENTEYFNSLLAPEARSARARWLSLDLGEDLCYEVHVIFETLESFQYVVV